MNGLLLYYQYLENIRNSVTNYDLVELDSKHFIPILKRVREIEDLSYIDVILETAGLDLSFLSDKSFLKTPVKLVSKLSGIFEENENDTVFSEYLNNFISKEDEIIEKLNEILGDEGIEEISSEYFPQSENKILDTVGLLETHKNALSSLFGGLSNISESVNLDSKNERNLDISIDESIDKMEVDFENNQFCDLEEQKLNSIDNKENEDSFFDTSFLEDDLEEQKLNSIDNKENENSFFDTSFLEDDLEEQKLNNINDKENKKNLFDTSFLEDDLEEDTLCIKNKDISLFLDDDDTKEEDSEKDLDIITDNHSKPFENRTKSLFDSLDEDEENLENELEENEDDEEDNSDFVLRSELEKLYPQEDINDTDPPDLSIFDSATNYFLNGKNTGDLNSLKELYKKKEKIVDIEEVTTVDDSLAKILLALGDGVLNLPNFTGNIMKKLKNGSKKLKETMIVEDEDDGEPK